MISFAISIGTRTHGCREGGRVKNLRRLGTATARAARADFFSAIRIFQKPITHDCRSLTSFARESTSNSTSPLVAEACTAPRGPRATVFIFSRSIIPPGVKSQGSFASGPVGQQTNFGAKSSHNLFFNVTKLRPRLSRYVPKNCREIQGGGGYLRAALHRS